MSGHAFRFRLATVLRVRRIEETRAREVLAATTREVARRSLEARRARAACDALPSVLPAMAPHEFDAFRQRAGWLAERAAIAAGELQRAVVEHSLAREQMLAARQRLEALERLADRRYREWQDFCVRVEATELDNVVTARAAAARLAESELSGTRP